MTAATVRPSQLTGGEYAELLADVTSLIAEMRSLREDIAACRAEAANTKAAKC